MSIICGALTWLRERHTTGSSHVPEALVSSAPSSEPAWVQAFAMKRKVWFLNERKTLLAYLHPFIVGCFPHSAMPSRMRWRSGARDSLSNGAACSATRDPMPGWSGSYRCVPSSCNHKKFVCH